MSLPCDVRRAAQLAAALPLLLLLLLLAPGCFVIPVGDLLRGPELREQVLIDRSSFFHAEKVVILDVEGLITGSESPGPFFSSKNVVAEMKAKLQWAASDPDVKAVVLRISSPGGEATACDIIYNELEKFRKERGIPVIASIEDVGASGGYYVAMAADRVYANPTAIIGSIGVIFQHLELHELLAKIGVSSSPIKSADKKDIGSPLRAMDPAERELLQKLVDDLYARFLAVVKAGRPQLSEDAIRSVADGRVVSGAEAARLQLVDEAGYLADALREAEKRTGLERLSVVRYTRAPSSSANIYSAFGREEPSGPELRISLASPGPQGPGVYYLWQPGL